MVTVMKRNQHGRPLALLVLLLALVSTFPGAAQLQSIPPARFLEAPQVIARGPHSRVWRHVVAEPSADGSVRQRVQTVTELENGMHFNRDGNANGPGPRRKNGSSFFQKARLPEMDRTN